MLEVVRSAGFIQVRLADWFVWAGRRGLFAAFPREAVIKAEHADNKVLVTVARLARDRVMTGQWRQLQPGLSFSQQMRRHGGLARPNRQSPQNTWRYGEPNNQVWVQAESAFKLTISWSPPSVQWPSVWREVTADSAQALLGWYWQEVWLSDTKWQDPRQVIDLLEEGRYCLTPEFRQAGYRWLDRQLGADLQQNERKRSGVAGSELAVAQSLSRAISAVSKKVARQAWWEAHPQILAKLAAANALSGIGKRLDRHGQAVDISWFTNFLPFQETVAKVELPMSLGESLQLMKQLTAN